MQITIDLTCTLQLDPKDVTFWNYETDTGINGKQWLQLSPEEREHYIVKSVSEAFNNANNVILREFEVTDE